MNSKYQEDLVHIRSMMEKSSQFISLSGLSGIFAGFFALIGAAIAYYLLQENEIYYFDQSKVTISSTLALQLFLLAFLILMLSIAFGVYFTIQKSKKKKIPFWNTQTKNVLIHLAVPLLTGGVFSLALIMKQLIYLISPTMLIFYGLALVNVSKFTYGDVKWLGYLEILLGLVSCFLMGYGLIFWAMGFGVLHIVYGIIMFNKYDRV